MLWTCCIVIVALSRERELSTRSLYGWPRDTPQIDYPTRPSYDPSRILCTYHFVPCMFHVVSHSFPAHLVVICPSSLIAAPRCQCHGLVYVLLLKYFPHRWCHRPPLACACPSRRQTDTVKGRYGSIDIF